jgi:hypothetical protein
VVKQWPRSTRELIYPVIDSPHPFELVGSLAPHLSD